MERFLALALLACTILPAQQPPAPTQLPGSPFFIKQTWVIGGVGNWDYLTMDAVAGRLFIAHGPVVQVVDVETGQLAGTVTGLREAHSVALDDTGEFGYVSDGPANQVKVFDRRTLAVVGTIATGPAPRAIVFEPRNRLLFAVCATPVPPAQPATGQGIRAPSAPVRNAPPRPPSNEEVKSSVTVIDAQTRQPLGEILMPGRLGFAQTDSNGQIFINMVSRNQIVRLDAQSIAALLGRRADRAAAAQTAAAPPSASQTSASQPAPPRPASGQPGQAASSPAAVSATSQVLDWSHESSLPNSAGSRMNLLSVGPDCRELSALAVDGPHERLFAACANLKLLVLNGGTGEQVASLPSAPAPKPSAMTPAAASSTAPMAAHREA